MDVSLKLQSDEFIVEEICGSLLKPDILKRGIYYKHKILVFEDASIGEVLRVSSVRPSPKHEEGNKGGIVVLKVTAITNTK